MENINYDEYLATMGKIESESIDRIKNYLEEQCKEDEALKTLYRPEKIKDCWKFIFECARKISKGNNACLEDGLVYKMARDYFIEVLPKVAENPPEVKTETKAETKVDAEVQNEAAETETEAEIVEEEAEPDDVVRDEYGFEIYGEEAPKPEEKEEEPVHQEINDSLLAGCKFDAGKIIDAKAQKLSFADFFPGLHFVHADRESYILDMVVCEVTAVDAERVSYRANETQFFWERKDVIESDLIPTNGNFYAIPEDAKVIGELDVHKRKLLDEAEAVTKKFDDEGNGLLFGF
ncbi:MAG: PcfK-like family protein [Treponema sp.]|nr:PcfK-like family protein [Treponema sp.]